jgi:2-polyprenyl-3-methyl-5-hydroxy-6-metoxy-1,4-benzoquinol methylase
MNSPAQMARLFDAKAEEFDAIYSGRKCAAGRAWDRLTRANIRTRFEYAMRAASPLTGKRVLDVGCGPGRYCVEAARLGAAGVVGLDVSGRMLELARGLAGQAGAGERCRFVEGDVTKFDDGEQFDVVFAMGFFDYVTDQVTVTRRLRSLCRGRIIASFPCVWALRVPARKVWWRAKGWRIACSSRGDVVRLCGQAGLRIVSLERQGPLYVLVAEA